MDDAVNAALSAATTSSPASWALALQDILVCRRIAGPDLFDNIMELRYKVPIPIPANNSDTAGHSSPSAATEDTTKREEQEGDGGQGQGQGQGQEDMTGEKSIGVGEKMTAEEEEEEIEDEEDEEGSNVLEPEENDDDDLYGDLGADDDQSKEDGADDVSVGEISVEDLYGDLGTNDGGDDEEEGVGGKRGAVTDDTLVKESSAMTTPGDITAASAKDAQVKVGSKRDFLQHMLHRLSKDKGEDRGKRTRTQHAAVVVSSMRVNPPYIIQDCSFARTTAYAWNDRGYDFASTFLQSYQLNSPLYHS